MAKMYYLCTKAVTQYVTATVAGQVIGLKVVIPQEGCALPLTASA